MGWLGRWCVVTLVLLGLASGWPAQARQVAQVQADAAAKAAAPEHEARQIEAMLVAPCCWREQVSVHRSEAAEQVKQEIRAMLAAGLTRQQVLDRFTSAYGNRILAEPPDAGIGRVLHHAPWVVGLGSLVGLALVIRHVTRRQHRGPAGAVAPDAGLSDPLVTPGTSADGEDAYRQRLDDELRELD